VRVIGRRQIEMYSRLIHTVDHIEGRLRPGFDALDALLTHMWAVTVTGAPKTWAMQFIEDTRRPRAAGTAVRSQDRLRRLDEHRAHAAHAHITGGIAAVRAGATLLYDSVPAAEEKETQIKARALLETLEEASRLPRAPRTPTRGSGGPVMVADGTVLAAGTSWPARAPSASRCPRCFWWTTRTRSCTRSPTTSGSVAPR